MEEARRREEYGEEKHSGKGSTMRCSEVRRSTAQSGGAGTGEWRGGLD
jgi:hypothetical protein